MLVYMDYSLYICVVKSIRLSYFRDCRKKAKTL